MNCFSGKFIPSFLLAFFLLIDAMQAQTYVSGGIYNNTTWTLANSPYIMTGSMVVFPGRTLTIEPGVEVRVRYGGIPNTGLMHYLEIRGSLVAIGTKENRILFHSETVSSDYSWLGINVKASQGGQITMDYFEFNDAYWGITADQQGSPLIDFHHCIFRHNNYAVQPFGPLNFYDCLFERNGQAIASGWQLNHVIGVKRCEFLKNFSCNGFQSLLSVDSCLVKENMNGIWYANGPITNTLFERNTFAIYAVNGNISNCNFKNNYKGLVEFLGIARNCSFSGNGLAAELATGCELSNSTFLNDTVAVAFAAGLTPASVLPIFKENQLCGSLKYYVENRSDLTISLDQNCFCETDSATIENLIFDGYDDFTKGLFNYTIYDNSCQNILRQVIKVPIPTSANPLLSGKFALYPIPATDVIRLSIPANYKSSGLRAILLDAQGRQLGAEQQISEDTNSWDISGLPSGMYTIRLMGSNSSSLRFFK